MNWIDEVQLRLKRKNHVLFAKDSEYLQDLIMLFQSQAHKTMILWALDFAAESIVPLAEKYPNELRPKGALEASKDWASGKIKMRFAQRKILDCHAIGQACAVVHTAGHAIGYPIYDLTSIIYKLGLENCVEAVERRKQEYIRRIGYWNVHAKEYLGEWASFLKNNRCIFCVFSSLFGGSSCLGIICFGTADTTTCGKLILRYLL